jgi:hypothetical protein
MNIEISNKSISAEINNQKETADTLRQKELAFKSVFTQPSYLAELEQLKENLPADEDAAKALLKEISEAEVEFINDLNEKKNKPQSTSNPLSHLLNMAMNIDSNKEFRPNKPLIEMQLKMNQDAHSAARKIQKKKHELMLSNNRLANYMQSKGYDINKINRAIKKGNSNDEMEALLRDTDAGKLMHENKEKIAGLNKVMSSDDSNKMFEQIKSGAISGPIIKAVNDEVDSAFTVGDDLVDTPIIKDGKLENSKKCLDDMMESIRSFIDRLFNRSSQMTP